MLKNRRFQFSKEVTVSVVLAAVTFSYLSYWQYTRYVEKKAYFAVLAEQEARGTHPFDPDTADWESEYHATVSVSGTWDHAHAMALINRSMGPTPGVKLVVPLVLDDPAGEGTRRALLVDRGFLSYEAFENGWTGRQTDGEVVHLEGILRPSQHTSFRFAPPEQPAPDGGFKDRWLRLTTEAMAEQLPYSVPPVFLEQTNTGTSEPTYNPREIIGPPRHLNYCFQWGGFALFALFLGALMQFPKIKHAGPAPTPEA